MQENHLSPRVRYILGFGAIMVLAAFISAVIASFFSEGLPVLLGTMIYCVPAVISSVHAFRYPAEKMPAAAVQSLLKGLMVRWFLAGLGFAATFVVAPTINAAAVFIGFCLMIPAHSVAATFASKQL